MSYGRRNGYGGSGYGGRRHSDFGDPKPVERNTMLKLQKEVTGVMVLLEYKDLLYLLKMEK